uniref:Uncharacterized protein n=1 Tax=Rhizophora mucronata TaxID=61149 RepID=A0A2P2QZ43_RHIMU
MLQFDFVGEFQFGCFWFPCMVSQCSADNSTSTESDINSFGCVFCGLFG